MIRINLLGVERTRTRKAIAFDIGQQLTLAASLILLSAALGIGWWYWTLSQSSAQLDTDLAGARQEATRLRTLLTEVGQFEAQRQQLQQRVTLISELRSGQKHPGAAPRSHQPQPPRHAVADHDGAASRRGDD